MKREKERKIKGRHHDWNQEAEDIFGEKNPVESSQDNKEERGEVINQLREFEISGLRCISIVQHGIYL